MRGEMQKVFFCFLIIAFSQSLHADSVKVTANNVNVRVRPVLGSEIITQINLGEEVEVLERGTEWTKIKVPVHSRCWVHSDYVKGGRITAGAVNMRCGPGLAFPVLCRLERGIEVNIVEVAGDWIRIEPPVEFGVWTSTQYLAFSEPTKVEEEIPAKSIVQEIVVEEEITETGIDTEIGLSQEPVLVVDTLDAPVAISVSQDEILNLELVTYAGVLEDLGMIINRPGTYKLISKGKWICILKSPTLDLNPYVNRVVRIEGIKVAVSSSWKVPILEVKRLQVIK